MREKILKSTVDRLTTGAKDILVWDTELPGFGLKVTPAGAKVYLVQYRTGGRGSPTRRVTIGKHGAPYTAETARKAAKTILGRVADGKDPAEEKRVAAASDGGARTFETVAEQFIDRYAKPKNRSWKQMQRRLAKHVTPHWGTRDITTIGRADVAELLDGIVDQGHGRLANMVHALVRKLFAWAMERDIVDRNPAAGFRPPAPNVSRDRVLSDDELRLAWLAADKMGAPFGGFVQMLILTLQRRDEVARLAKSELDLSERMWQLPRERVKNDEGHLVPLSEAAAQLLADTAWLGEYAFSTTGAAPISGYSKMKARLTQLMEAIRRKEAEAAGHDVGKLKPLANWHLHDLRRTGATGMARMGVPPHVVDKILNHKSGTISGVAAVYNRHSYLDERRSALESWARFVDTLVYGRSNNVVPLRAPVPNVS